MLPGVEQRTGGVKAIVKQAVSDFFFSVTLSWQVELEETIEASARREVRRRFESMAVKGQPQWPIAETKRFQLPCNALYSSTAAAGGGRDHC